MQKKLRILACPMGAVGHINAVQGLTDEFRARGHDVVFVLDEAYAGRLRKNGYEEKTVRMPERDDGIDTKEEFWLQYVRKHSNLYDVTPLEQMTSVVPRMMGEMFHQVMTMGDQYKVIIKEYQPDMIIYDGYVGFPAILDSGIPMLWLYSAAVNGLLHMSEFPPPNLGLPLNGDKREWAIYGEKCGEAFKPLTDKVQKALKDIGIELEPGRMHPFPNFLTVFMQPKELRYDIPIPDNCLAVESFVRTEADAQNWEVPEKVRSGKGKLIYFSMGSFCCSHFPLMKKLLAILAKSPHRFIVSMGIYPEELPGDNMWGARFLPQTAVLQKVDFMITHGGNNTVTEGFFYGVPMLVGSFFADQHDLGQRILEVGLGDRVNPFRVTEEELLAKIEKLVNDEELRQKMKRIGERVRSSNDRKLVVDLVEERLIKN